MSKTTAAKTVAPVSILTPAMLEENAASRQTMWVALGDVALRFRKLYVPGAPRGSVFGLLRSVKGEAFLVHKTETTPAKYDEHFAPVAPVTVNARRFDAWVALESSDKDGACVAFLIDENNRCYRVSRASAYSNDGYES